MRKLEGLRFLQRHFGDLCVDCLFLPDPRIVASVDLDPQVGRVWRVRAGRRMGSEVNLPHRSCRTVDEVVRFVKRFHNADPLLEFVIHRLTEEYWSAWYVGTLALLDRPHPIMTIDLQDAQLHDNRNSGDMKKPRDWEVALRLSYDFLVLPPKIDMRSTGIHAGLLDFLKYPLYRLHAVGTEIYDLTHKNTNFFETVARFKIYKTGDVIFDDLRGVDSFRLPLKNTFLGL